jgi:hypothetical protein
MLVELIIYALIWKSVHGDAEGRAVGLGMSGLRTDIAIPEIFGFLPNVKCCASSRRIKVG